MGNSKLGEVGLPPTVKKNLSKILAHAAARERTVIEFRTTELDDGSRHFSHAIPITDHVEELEAAAETEQPSPSRNTESQHE